MTNSQESDSSTFSIRWPTLSLSLAVITLTTVGTLVVVVDQKDIDILSTVALALAVLSFAAQLIVTMAQSFQSSQVNAEMKETLAAMSANTNALLTNQREQYDTILKAALRVIPDAVKEVNASDNDDERSDSGDSEALAERIIDKLRDELRDTSPKTVVRGVPSVNTAGKRKVRTRLDTLPDRAEGEPVAQILNDLAPGPIAQLAQIITTVFRNGRSSGQVTYGPRNGESPTFEYIDLLAEHGLIESSPTERGGRTITLTDEGWIAGALIRSRTQLPAWAETMSRRQA